MLASSYFFLIYNMVSKEHNFFIGYISIGFTSLYIFLSLLFIASTIVIGVRLTVRTKLVMHKYKRSRRDLHKKIVGFRATRKAWLLKRVDHWKSKHEGIVEVTPP